VRSPDPEVRKAEAEVYPPFYFYLLDLTMNSWWGGIQIGKVKFETGNKILLCVDVRVKNGIEVLELF
jgi:hypothetical protein